MAKSNLRIGLLERDEDGRVERRERPGGASTEAAARVEQVERPSETPLDGFTVSGEPFRRALETETGETDSGSAPVRWDFRRRIEADDELRIDESRRDVPYHVCRHCGADNPLDLAECLNCQSPLGGPGQREHDLATARRRQAQQAENDRLNEEKRRESEENERARDLAVARADVRSSRQNIGDAKIRLIYILFGAVPATALYLYGEFGSLFGYLEDVDSLVFRFWGLVLGVASLLIFLVVYVVLRVLRDFDWDEYRKLK